MNSSPALTAGYAQPAREMQYQSAKDPPVRAFWPRDEQTAAERPPDRRSFHGTRGRNPKKPVRFDPTRAASSIA